MKKIFVSSKSEIDLDYSGRTKKITLPQEIYDRYAPAFYGEIKRQLFDVRVCDQVLISSFKRISEQIHEYDESKENLFIWCYRVVRKEINKKKIDLLLKEIFACQSYLIIKED